MVIGFESTSQTFTTFILGSGREKSITTSKESGLLERLLNNNISDS